MSLRDRAAHKGLHGRAHVNRQRLVALLMICSGLLRVAVWALLILLYLFHVKFARDLYASVSFVALLSVVALLLTDWGQVAASLAQLTAGDAHHDAERTRASLAVDYREIEADIARLAALRPSKQANALTAEIVEKLRKASP